MREMLMVLLITAGAGSGYLREGSVTEEELWVQGARSQLQQVARWLEIDRVSFGELPESQEAFEAWAGNRFIGTEDCSPHLDPWGTPVAYSLTEGGKRFELRCAGPDRMAGTTDDIRVR